MTVATRSPRAAATVAPPRRALRAWWKDSLEASAWLAGVGAIAFMLASGTATFSTLAGLSTTLGRATGMVAAMMIMLQLVLASRAPIVERVVGHDRALELHGRLGRIGFFVLLTHIATITFGYAAVSHTGYVDQTLQFVVGYSGTMTAAVIGFGVLCAIIVTSLAAVRARWRYEDWHAVHLFSYAAIALTIPHQFLDGTTFSTAAGAWWYWAILWGVCVGLFVVFRMIRPLWLFVRHDLRVAQVTTLPDGSAVVAIRGRGLKRLRPRPGQFFLFRFLTPELWDEAHPFSMSRARSGDWIRITVKPLGDFSSGVGALAPGTRVSVEGPLGVFHDRSRTSTHLVLAGAGIGLAPILSMLEGADFAPGQCTVIVRARSREEAPHLDEIIGIAEKRGAAVWTVFGKRGRGWSSADQPMNLRTLVPVITDADIYACGPDAWVESLREDARGSGVADEAFHFERFGW